MVLDLEEWIQCPGEHGEWIDALCRHAGEPNGTVDRMHAFWEWELALRNRLGISVEYDQGKKSWIQSLWGLEEGSGAIGKLLQKHDPGVQLGYPWKASWQSSQILLQLQDPPKLSESRLGHMYFCKTFLLDTK
jgi:hypothetical protein